MTLGNKIVALFLILGMSFSIGIYIALQWSVFPTFADFERESFEEALARVARVVSAQELEVGSVTA